METAYVPNAKRYEGAQFRRCGRAGIVLPPVSLGLWQNFGGVDVFETGRAMIRRAFDRGVTHFDLANNYGPPYGSAEENFGHELLAKNFSVLGSTASGKSCLIAAILGAVLDLAPNGHVILLDLHG
jgi:L-glyceraldehyde 3-phosphate reductase